MTTAKRIVIEVNAVSHVVFDEGQMSEQHWITVLLDSGWMAAYRVTSTGVSHQRRARIGEIRIVPTDSPARFGLDWSYEYYMRLAKKDGRTVGPFPFEATRRVITARHLDDALAVAASISSGDNIPSRRETSPRRRGGGRPGHGLKFYAQFAMRFDAVENHPRRERARSTRKILARTYKVPDSTIGKWISTCRRRGLLTPSDRGSRGGMATAFAQDLCSGGEK